MKQTVLIFLAVVLSFASFASFAVAPITGVTLLCQADTAALTNATPGGTWSSGDISVATIDPGTGVVRGFSPGTAIITYTAGASYATTTVTVNFLSTMMGISSICSGIGTTYTNATPGGTWATDPVTVATINPTTGVFAAVAGGMVDIYYIMSPGCYTVASVTVRQTPAISGTLTVPLGGTRTLTGTPAGGLWMTSSTAIAVGSLTGVVTGITAGTASLDYIKSGCPATAIVTVMSTTGINGTMSNEDVFSVYPNPAADHIEVGWQHAVTGTANVVITDMAGRTVYSTTVTMNYSEGRSTIQLPALSNGLYVIDVSSAHQSYKAKLQVQR